MNKTESLEANDSQSRLLIVRCLRGRCSLRLNATASVNLLKDLKGRRCLLHWHEGHGACWRLALKARNAKRATTRAGRRRKAARLGALEPTEKEPTRGACAYTATTWTAHPSRLEEVRTTGQDCGNEELEEPPLLVWIARARWAEEITT